MTTRSSVARLAALLVGAIFMVACSGPIHRPAGWVRPTTGVLEAWKVMDATAREMQVAQRRGWSGPMGPCQTVKAYTLDRKGISLEYAKGPVRRFEFAQTPDPEIMNGSMKASMYPGVFLMITGMGTEPPLCWPPGDVQKAFQAADAWSILAQPAALTPPTVDSAAIGASRELPEEARRYKVEAEVAVEEKRFVDAAIAFEKGLKIAPWWPAGRYNSALVLSEIGFFSEAVQEMKRYLLLAPDASNARGAQDKIYEWEAKAGR